MLTIIAVVTIVTLALLCFSLYKSKLSDFPKLLALPMVLLLATLLGWHYLDNLGKPIDGYPEGKWEYVFHSTDGTTIELWVKQEGDDRLYTFPYSQQQREQLEQAKQAEEQGVPIEGEFELVEVDGSRVPTARSPISIQVAGTGVLKPSTGG